MVSAVIALAVAGALFAGSTQNARAEEQETPPSQKWSFAGPFGKFDRGSMQRGLKVYKEVCSNCHSLSYIAFRNLADPGVGAHGRLEVNAGTLLAANIDNGGLVTIAGGAALTTSSSFLNQVNATVAGGGTLDVSAATFENNGILSPGLSPGTLRVVGAFTQTPTAEVHIEIGGLEPGIQHDVLSISGMASFDGALHVTYPGGFVPQPWDTFTVIQISAGPAAMAPGAQRASFDCYSGLQLPGGIFLKPIELPDAFLLAAVDSVPPNDPPLAGPDSGSVYGGLPVTLRLLANDADPDGDPLRILSVGTEGVRGTVYVNAGDTTVTYLPPLSYATADTFTYCVTDCEGGVDSADVYVEIAWATGIAGERRVPARCALHPNVPNPFHPVTAIRYELPQAGPAELAIFDVTGRRVRVLATGYHAAGSFSRDWDGRGDDGREAAPGVYFARLVAGDFVGARKMVLTR